MSKHFYHKFWFTESIILCIIIGDVHQFISYCRIPLDPWEITGKNINGDQSDEKQMVLYHLCLCGWSLCGWSLGSCGTSSCCNNIFISSQTCCCHSVIFNPYSSFFQNFPSIIPSVKGTTCPFILLISESMFKWLADAIVILDNIKINKEHIL